MVGALDSRTNKTKRRDSALKSPLLQKPSTNVTFIASSMGAALELAAGGGVIGGLVGLAMSTIMDCTAACETGYTVVDPVDHTIAGCLGGEIAGALAGRRLYLRHTRKSS